MIYFFHCSVGNCGSRIEIMIMMVGSYLVTRKGLNGSGVNVGH